MKIGNKESESEKYSKIFGLNDMLYISKTKLVFTDEQLEKDYSDYLVMGNRNNKFFIDLVIYMIILFRLLVSKLTTEIKLYYSLELTLFLAGLFLLVLVHLFIKNMKMIKFFDQLLPYFILCTNIYITLLNHIEFKNNNKLDYDVRDIYILILTSFVLPLFFYEYNLVKLIIFYTMTNATLTYIAIISYTVDKKAYIEVMCFNILFSFLPFYNREKSLTMRREFLKNHQLNKIYEYFSGIVNNMNGMLVSVRKGLICINSNPRFLQMAQSNKLLDPFSEKNKESFNSPHQKLFILDPESIKIEAKQDQEENKNSKKIK